MQGLYVFLSHGFIEFLKCTIPQNKNCRRKCLCGLKETTPPSLLLGWICYNVVLVYFWKKAIRPTQSVVHLARSSPRGFKPFLSFHHYSCEFSVAACVFRESHPSAFPFCGLLTWHYYLVVFSLCTLCKL